MGEQPMTARSAQLAAWVRGEPHHNTTDNECCPDFSCCCPSLLWPKDQREAFAAAPPHIREQMLMMGLGAALAEAGKRDGTYIVGLDRGADQ